MTPNQTLNLTLNRLLGLPDDAELWRDLDSPKPIRDDEVVLFADGPVFRSRITNKEVRSLPPDWPRTYVNSERKVLYGTLVSTLAFVEASNWRGRGRAACA